MNADTEGSAKTRIQLISQLYHSPQIIRTGLIWYYTFGKADLQAQNIVRGLPSITRSIFSTL